MYEKGKKKKVEKKSEENKKREEKKQKKEMRKEKEKREQMKKRGGMTECPNDFVKRAQYYWTIRDDEKSVAFRLKSIDTLNSTIQIIKWNIIYSL